MGGRGPPGRGGGGQRVRGDEVGNDVGNVDEVAGLPAIAVDRDAPREDADDPGIGGGWVLPRPIDVEEAQADGGDAVDGRPDRDPGR